MNQTSKRFLEALKASLKGQTIYWDNMSAEEWKKLFRISETQQLLPMVYQAVYKCLASQGHGDVMKVGSRKTMNQIARQVTKTSEFLALYQQFCELGAKPLVLKGVICRNLYPNPDQRPSTDEDILILPEHFDKCHECCLDFGMHLLRENQDIITDYEVSYWKDNTKLYIELHKALFPTESKAYGDLNQLFEGVHERAIQENIQGTDIYTLSHTDHLLFLICHALKHFIAGGFGIRQACDITLFANKYGSQIDWEFVMECCKSISAEKLAAGIFRIGDKYLTFDPEQACYPKIWGEIEVDEKPLLEDMLMGGVLGNSSMGRIHSRNITIHAVTSQKDDMVSKNKFWGILFPSRKYMARKYKYLDKHPYLLPVAWITRMLRYGLETNEKDNNPTQSIKIGEERIELLRRYGVLK